MDDRLHQLADIFRAMANLLARVREICQVPLVASGGAGATEHFVQVFQRAGVDAALAASVFHSAQLVIGDLKRSLRADGIEVRP